MKRQQKILLVVAGFLLIIGIIVGVVVGVRSGSNRTTPKVKDDTPSSTSNVDASTTSASNVSTPNKVKNPSQVNSSERESISTLESDEEKEEEEDVSDGSEADDELETDTSTLEKKIHLDIPKNATVEKINTLKALEKKVKGESPKAMNVQLSSPDTSLNSLINTSREWWVQDKYLSKYQESSSFGHSMELLHKNSLFVGCPFDGSYGRLIIFGLDKYGMQKSHNLLFHDGVKIRGNVNQKAAYAISGQFVACPDYAVDQDNLLHTPGTVFYINKWGEEDERIHLKQLHISQHSGNFEMVKSGQCIYFHDPYLFVTKEQQGHYRVDVFYWNQETRNVNLLQKFEEANKKASTLGQWMVCNSNNTRLYILNPVKNSIFVFERDGDKTTKWSYLKRLLMVCDEFSQVHVLEKGDQEYVIVSQKIMQKVSIFKWNQEKKNLDSYQILSTVTDKTFCTMKDFQAYAKLTQAPQDPMFGESVAMEGDWLLVYGSTHLYLYIWRDIQYDFVETVDLMKFVQVKKTGTFKNIPRIRPNFKFMQSKSDLNILFSVENDPMNHNVLMWVSKGLK